MRVLDNSFDILVFGRFAGLALSVSDSVTAISCIHTSP